MRARPIVPLRILVVSGVPYRREVLTVSLSARSPAIVESAFDGEQAKRMIRSAPPDVVILDSEIGETDGFTLASILRGYEETMRIPFVFLARPTDERISGIVTSIDELILSDTIEIPVIASRIEKALFAAENARLREKLARMECDLAALDGKDSRSTALDPLSGMFKYDTFLSIAARILTEDNAEGIDTSLIVADIVGLADINARFGFSTGDRVIVQVATIINDTLKQLDAVSTRCGGDKFVALISGISARLAGSIIVKIRNTIAGVRFPIEEDSVGMNVRCAVVPITVGNPIEAQLLAAFTELKEPEKYL